MEQENFTNDSVSNADLKKLALDKDFGRLNFENILKQLQDLQKTFVEFDELNFINCLTQEEINVIISHKNNFVALLNRLKNFDIGQANSQVDHDQIEQEIINLNNNVQKSSRAQLVYLRQEAEVESQDTEELKRLQKETFQTKQEYEKLSSQLKEQLEVLSQKKKDIADKKGEVAAETFGKHFEIATKSYKEKADKKWYILGRNSFIILLVIVIINFLLYLYLFIGNKANWFEMKPTEFFTIEYGLVKLALLILLSYVVGFSSRQYSINSHLAASNKHRKNIAETMKDFYESDMDATAKSFIINKGTETMFENLPIGHISKSENKDNDGPIHQIFNQIPKINGK